MKNLIPKTIQVDEVFEINSDSLQDIETVNLILWKSRDDFEKAYFQRSESLYDGFGVDPKQSMTSTGSKDAAYYLFNSKSPRESLKQIS